MRRLLQRFSGRRGQQGGLDFGDSDLGLPRRPLQLNVFGDIEQHRTGFARGGHTQGLFHRRNGLGCIAQLAVPFGHRARHAERVTFLKRLCPDHPGGHLPADAQHRDSIAVGIEQTGDGVAHPRPRGDQHHSHASCAAGVAFGRMHCSLLVAHQHMPECRAQVERVVQGQGSTTGVTEHRVDAAGQEGVQQQFGAVGQCIGRGGEAGGVLRSFHADTFHQNWQNVFHLSGNFHVETEKYSEKIEIEEETPVQFDRFDMAILRELTIDSRKTLQEIGAAVNLSPTTCWSRIKRLEAEGVIKRYTVDLNRAKLGWQDTVIVQLTLDSHTDEALYEFGRTLATIPEVMEAYLISGDYDYFIRIAVRNTRDYERLLREKLYKIPGIRHSKSSFVLRVLKDERMPL